MVDGRRKESYLIGKERDEGLSNANQHTRLKKGEGYTNANLTAHAHANTQPSEAVIVSKKGFKKRNQSIKRASYPQGMVKENALKRQGISNVQKQGYIGGLNT